jgi:zinc-ribbon domain
VGESIRRTIVICPKCGEDNADSFRFCGMCGAPLETPREARRPGSAPGLDPLSALPAPISTAAGRIANPPEVQRPQLVENAPWPTGNHVAPISGPSMLGLDRPGPTSASQPSPSLDSLREKSFSGLDSFVEPERPKNGAGRIFLMVVLLAALGAAGWWTYTNYLSAVEGGKPAVATSNAGEAAAQKPATAANPPVQETNSGSNAGSGQTSSAAQVPPPPAQVPEGPSENATAGPDAAKKTALDAETKAAAAETRSAAEVYPSTSASAAPPPAITVPAHRSAPKHEPPLAASKPTNVAVSGAVDSGDAAFRRGEAYLYGRGVPENCDEAVRNLKAASAKSNAKARSAFGTMYATGHCVSRDLPTSYLWFALALRVDPNNQILEKDLNAIWNQMTPPERQMATRMKE